MKTAFQQTRIVTDSFLSGIAGNIFKCRIGVLNGAIQSSDRNELGRLFNRCNQLGSLSLRLLLLGDIGHTAFVTDNLAVMIVNRMDVIRPPDM